MVEYKHLIYTNTTDGPKLLATFIPTQAITFFLLFVCNCFFVLVSVLLSSCLFHPICFYRALHLHTLCGSVNQSCRNMGPLPKKVTSNFSMHSKDGREEKRQPAATQILILILTNDNICVHISHSPNVVCQHLR